MQTESIRKPETTLDNLQYTARVSFAPNEIVFMLLIGFVAGILGGMLGIGGSIIIIPGLTILLALNQHLSQAVAMIINVFVTLPALLQHSRAKAVRWDVFARMIPFGIVLILVGVASSNAFDAVFLKRIFGLFLIYVIAVNVHLLFTHKPHHDKREPRIGWLRVGITGCITGFLAGLLGIGGGIIAVPLLQNVCRLPLRQAIGTTAAFMCMSATIGSMHKNFTLNQIISETSSDIAVTWQSSVVIALLLAPTAMLGGLLGGKLTHTLPLNWVRIVFILLMTWASANMLGLI